MPKRVSGFNKFLAEIKRRHVVRVSIAYLAVVFVILQLGEIVLPAFNTPDWGLRYLVVFCALGFPVAVVLAWVYEITPQGIRRTAQLDPSGQRGGSDGSLFARLALLVLTLVTMSGAGWWRYAPTSRRIRRFAVDPYSRWRMPPES